MRLEHICTEQNAVFILIYFINVTSVYRGIATLEEKGGTEFIGAKLTQITVQNFRISNSHQGCSYLIKNKV